MLKEANRDFTPEEIMLPERIDLVKEGITVMDGLVYARTEDGVLRMDLLTDEEFPGPKPVILWIHGGGFTEEHVTRKSRPEKRFLRLLRRGYMIAAIDYRLSQVRPFPSQIMDCKCAVRFLRANADRFGIDPERIGAWGESCGGQLAGLMSVNEGIPAFEDRGGYEGVKSSIRAAVSWYGALDVMEFHEARMAVDDVYPGRFEVMYGGKPDDPRILELLRSANPLEYAGLDTCPLLAMCSDGDTRVPYTVNFAFCEKVTARGGTAEFVRVPGQGHGYFEGEEFDETVFSFFDRYLKG